MSKLLRRGLGSYKIFLKNKIAMSVMMLVAMPLGITVAGAAITFWSFYKIGYIKADLDKIESESKRDSSRMALIEQIGETVLYLAVAAVGIYLLLNQSVMNRVLNLMSGGFTTLNGANGVIYVVKRRAERNFGWWFKLVLTVVELVMGPYFLICCDSVEGGWFIAMGALTMVAGTIEVISALTPESIRGTMQDGKDIVRILKE